MESVEEAKFRLNQISPTSMHRSNCFSVFGLQQVKKSLFCSNTDIQYACILRTRRITNDTVTSTAFEGDLLQSLSWKNATWSADIGTTDGRVETERYEMNDE